MALDATVAGESANSYLSVADADELAATDPINGDHWAQADDPAKERALVAATRDVEVFKGAVGTAYSLTQARRFPRVGDLAGDPAEPYLLEPLRMATYEQAVHLLVNGRLIADGQARRAQGTLSQQDANGAWTAALDPRFGRYAQAMIEYLSEIVAVTRPGGRRIIDVPIGVSL